MIEWGAIWLEQLFGRSLGVIVVHCLSWLDPPPVNNWGHTLLTCMYVRVIIILCYVLYLSIYHCLSMWLWSVQWGWVLWVTPQQPELPGPSHCPISNFIQATWDCQNASDAVIYAYAAVPPTGRLCLLTIRIYGLAGYPRTPAVLCIQYETTDACAHMHGWITISPCTRTWQLSKRECQTVLMHAIHMHPTNKCILIRWTHHTTHQIHACVQ